MLGSGSDADDAVQEAWLRLSRSDTSEVGTLGGWLTTIVARVCLDRLRSHEARREVPLSEHVVGAIASGAEGIDPEHELLLADSRGGDFDAPLALLDPDVVLRADRAAVSASASREVRGAPDVARTFSGRARVAQPALVNGAVGVVWAPGGRPRVVFGITMARGRIVAIGLVADAERIRQLDLVILDD